MLDTAHTPMNETDIEQLIRDGDEHAVRALAGALAQKNNERPGQRVVDGNDTVTDAFSKAAKRRFMLNRQVMVGKTPVYEWISPTQEIETGALVRNYFYPQGTASLHIVLSSHKMGDGYSMGYSICIMRPYDGGVGLDGQEAPRFIDEERAQTAKVAAEIAASKAASKGTLQDPAPESVMPENAMPESAAPENASPAKAGMKAPKIKNPAP